VIDGRDADAGRGDFRISRAAVETVDGCDHAAISLVHRHRAIDTVAATDEVPTRVDAIQYEVGQGPCLNAIAEHEVFLADDLADDERWPNFSHRAVEETGVRSMLSFRLFLQDDTLGALNLYSRDVQAFDEHAPAVGHGRDHGLGGLAQKDAFAVLLRASQHLNRKLRDVASEVVETGEVPCGLRHRRRRRSRRHPACLSHRSTPAPPSGEPCVRCAGEGPCGGRDRDVAVVVRRHEGPPRAVPHEPCPVPMAAPASATTARPSGRGPDPRVRPPARAIAGVFRRR
jgi:GAF domain